MKRPKSTTRQRGIALMMTLGVLALLLIMALAFAYTTRTERLAASVNADLIRARLLAESGVERAIAFLREQYPGNPAPATQIQLLPGPDTRFPSPAALGSESFWVSRAGRYLASVSTVRASEDGLQHHIKDALASTIRVESTSYQFTPASELSGAVGWIPIKVTHGAGIESCVGLVGYLVIDETGKIDPTQAVGGAYGITPTPTEATSSPDIRLGLYPGEIAMADCYTEQLGWSYSYGPIFGDAFQSRMTSPGRWDSLYNIMNRFRLPLAPVGRLALDPMWVNRFTWSLRPFSVDEPEAYSDTPGGALRHRCDINNIDTTNPVNDNDWNGVNVEVLPPQTPPVYLFPSGSESADQAYPAGQPVGTTGVGLPWIGQILPAPADATLHKQVMANVIDFLDADVFYAGSDAPPTDTENDYDAAANLATYVGLEDVPYANEIFVRMAYVEPWPSVPLPPLISFEIRIDVDADVELVNIYDTPRTIGRVDLDLEVECKLLAPPALPETQTVHIPYRCDGVVVPAHSYVLASTSWGTPVRIAPLFSLAMVGGIGRVYLTVKSAKVTLNEDGSAPGPTTLWDFAQPPASPEEAFDMASAPREASADVNDPRCNTDAAQWTWNAFVASSGATHAGGAITAGSRNTHCTNPGGSDADDVDPINWSTAFIRNGPVVSFWELGAIHRAEPWRTLNLHSSTQAVADSGQYAYGDWPLLNQVKLSPATTTGRGLINAWDIQPAVWKPLLQGLCLGASYGNPARTLPGPGTRLTVAEVPTVDTALVTASADIAASAPTWTPAAGALHGRAAVVGYTKLADGTLALGPGVPAQDVDSRQEELIGKVVGLLNDRISYYTVLVCAMAVQDVGELPAGLTVPPDWIKYETGPDKYCRPMAEQKVMALVWRDFATSQFRIASFEYLED